MRLIKGKTFKDEALFIEGDDVILDDCEFTGTPHDEEGSVVEAMIMSMGSRLSVRGCYLHAISGSGIVLRSTEPSIGASIEYNTLLDIRDNGIMSKEGNYDVIIRHNELFNVGQNANGKFHPMYIKSPDTLVLENTIIGTKGNGISMRSSGTVSKNIIDNAGKSCVRYFPDGDRGASDILYINDNQLYRPGVKYAAISLLWSPIGKMVSHYEIVNNFVGGAAMKFWASPQFAGKYEYLAG